MEPKSFIVQAKEFFGLKPSQTLQEFSTEIKALTEKDKAELSEMLTKAGYPVK